MSQQQMMKMTAEVAIKCNLLDQMIESFLAARNSLDGSYRKYESNCEAINLFSLTIRNIEE
jgi:hypothetical protein